MQFAVQVIGADGATVVQSERNLLDITTVAVWLTVQTAEMATGEKCIVWGLADGSALPEGWPAAVSLVGPAGPTGEAGPAGPSYELPIASDTVLGGVKIGSGVTIDPDGTIHATGGGGDGGDGDTIVENSTAGFPLGIGWSTLTEATSHGGTCMSDNETGNTCNFTFTGTRCRVYGAPFGAGGQMALQVPPYTTPAFLGTTNNAAGDYTPVLLWDTGTLTEGTYMWQIAATHLSAPLILDYISITP